MLNFELVNKKANSLKNLKANFTNN